MKSFFVQAFWIIVITLLLNFVAGVIFSVALPDADLRALGQIIFLPSLIVAMFVTFIGRRMGRLTGKRKSRTLR